MHNYVKQNITVHFIIQKLKNKHTFLKNQIFRTLVPLVVNLSILKGDVVYGWPPTKW
jgi:hypothetical protein